MESFRQFLDQYIMVPTNRYRKAKTFSGIQGPINGIIFVDHRIVVTGGDDHAVSVWDIQQYKLLQKLHDRGTDLWGQITSLVSTDTPEDGQGFVVGTGRGVIVAFKLVKSQKKVEFQEQECFRAFAEDNFVETLAFDPNHKRLVVSSHLGNLKLYQLEPNGTWIEKWKISNHVNRLVRGLHFTDLGQKFMSYTMESGSVHAYDTATGKEIPEARRSLQSFVANMDYFPDTQAVLVDNLLTGFDMYAPTRASPTQRFEAKRLMSRAYAVEVRFGENGTLAVGGSDHGVIYLFQSNSGEMLQTLLHSTKATLIQTIATHTSPDGEHIIVSGSSKMPSSSICIWKRPEQRSRTSQAVQGQVAVAFMGNVFSTFYHLTFVVLLAAVVWNTSIPKGALTRLSTLHQYVAQSPSPAIDKGDSYMNIVLKGVQSDQSSSPAVDKRDQDMDKVPNQGAELAWLGKLPISDLERVSELLQKARDDRKEKLEGDIPKVLLL